MAYEKLGLHIITPRGYAGPMGNPRLVKIVDPSIADVSDLRAAVGPDCLIVVRFYTQNQALTRDAAREWFYSHFTAMTAMRIVGGKNIAFEFYCEIDRSQMAALVQTELAWLDYMHSEGLRAIVGNWGVGNPGPEQWRDYMPVLDALAPGDALGLHDYWAWPDDIANVWYCGRWRHPDAPGKLRQVAIVATELGRDVIADRRRHGKHGGYSGWRLYGDGWDAYEGELIQYHDEILLPYPNVIGGVVYQAGALDDKWQPFDMAEYWHRITAKYAGGTMPQPQPEPIPNCLPNITTVILPVLNSHLTWYAADTLFGPDADHPDHAWDLNLETFGNTDLGQPLVAPFDGIVFLAKNLGGGYGNCLRIVGLEADGAVVCDEFRHMDRFDVWLGQIVKSGQVVGAIGNTGVTSAHLHEQICVGEVPRVGVLARDPLYNFVAPAKWYRDHGIDAAVIERITKYDHK